MRNAVTRYAPSGEARIGYQAVGHGSLDLVLVPGFPSNLELLWEDPDLQAAGQAAVGVLPADPVPAARLGAERRRRPARLRLRRVGNITQDQDVFYSQTKVFAWNHPSQIASVTRNDVP
ncbi:MAG: hypothetical protein ABIF45_17970 [Pseudomonadota bacterium]